MEASQPPVPPQPGFKAGNKELLLTFHRLLPFLKFGPFEFVSNVVENAWVAFRQPSILDFPDVGHFILIVCQTVNGAVLRLDQREGGILWIQFHPSGLAVVLESGGKLPHGELTVGDQALGAGKGWPCGGFGLKHCGKISA